ncbi:MAG: hypothetical protein C0425_11515 [Chlorobiaceae bacterium]|nr:hypothetical protein [Chlorobiaceae bacterium]
MINQNKRLFGIILAVPILLLIPLIVMLFSDEVKWTLSDFIIAGILLLSAGLTFEFILRKIKITKLRIAFCVVLFFVFVLVWGELAVGIFGTPFGGS